MSHIKKVEPKKIIPGVSVEVLIDLLGLVSPEKKVYFPFGSFTLVEIQGVFIENSGSIILMPTEDRYGHDPMKYSWKDQGKLLKP